MAGGILFEMLTGRRRPSLVHPTNKAFNIDDWVNVLSKTDCADDDMRLYKAAVVCSHNLVKVRAGLDALLQSTNGQKSVHTLIAASNQQFFVVLRKSLSAARKYGKQTRGPTNLERAASARFLSKPGGQQMAADTSLEIIVDSIPHWLFYAVNADNKAGDGIDYSLIPSVLALASLEKAYREIWQKCLWQGASIESDSKEIIIAPRDKTQEERWEAWVARD